MLPNNYETPGEFLKRMDAGEFDGKLYVELQKLTKDQLIKLAAVLLYRDGQVEATGLELRLGHQSP
jgi:hypothetical protein